MPFVLTDQAVIRCGHQGPTRGTVKVVASQRKLTVDGHPVLVAGDLEGKPITGCPLKPPSNTPCTMLATVLTGQAGRLRVGTRPVLLSTAGGITNGVPPGRWYVESAGQTKLSGWGGGSHGT